MLELEIRAGICIKENLYSALSAELGLQESRFGLCIS